MSADGSQPCARAHPRSRGEHVVTTFSSPKIEGSSPLTRGALGVFSAVAVAGGLIPAHAGSTKKHAAISTDCRAHPRSRGEHVGGSAQKMGETGSSPLTRGAHSLTGRVIAAIGLIPAHAGSTYGSH